MYSSKQHLLSGNWQATVLALKGIKKKNKSDTLNKICKYYKYNVTKKYNHKDKKVK